jgi:hypothetical protein
MITVRIVDEEFREVQPPNIDLDPTLLTRVLPDAELNGLRCLAFVDPYGETVFNRQQLPVLIDELDWLRQRCANPSDQELVRELKRLAGAALEDVHLYLRFTGN